MSVASTFLRRALLVDAAASAATGLLMSAAAGPLSSLLSLPVPLLRGAGLVLVPYVVFVLVVATRRAIVMGAVLAVIACNVVWTLASFAILIDAPIAPSVLGKIFVVGQALAVAALGGLQYVALRRPRAALA